MAARRAALLLLMLGILGFFGVAPAFADDVTITSPSVDGETVSFEGFGGAFRLAGTYAGSSELILYIDDVFLTCDLFPADDPDDDFPCYMPLNVQDGQFSTIITEQDLRENGISLEGPHTFEVVEWIDPDGFDGDQGRRGGSDSVVVIVSGSGLAGPVSAAEPGLESGDPAAPSTLSSLTPAGELGLTPTRAVMTAGLTIILLLIVGFPGQVISSTLEKNYDRMFGWATPIKERLSKVGGVVPRWLSLSLGLAFAILISAFVDPEFGLNPGSVRLVLSLAIAFVVQSVLGWIVIRRVVRRSHPDEKAVVRFRWGSLLIVALSVVISRLVGFEPGMVFGLVAGLYFGATIVKARDARVVLAGVGWAFVLALIGWLLYSALSPWLGGADNVVGTFVLESLGGIATAGLAALPIALFPLAVFDGGTLFAWNRWLWGACYAVAMWVFLVILLPLPTSWGAVDLPWVTWVVLYALYALAGIGLWLYFRLSGRKQPAIAT